MEVTNPLNIKIGCPFIRSGIIDIIPNGEDTRTVDFGNGDCDANYSVTVNGKTWDLSVQ